MFLFSGIHNCCVYNIYELSSYWGYLHDNMCQILYSLSSILTLYFMLLTNTHELPNGYDFSKKKPTQMLHTANSLTGFSVTYHIHHAFREHVYLGKMFPSIMFYYVSICRLSNNLGCPPKNIYETLPCTSSYFVPLV